MTTTNLTHIVQSVTAGKVVRFWGDPIEFASFLLGLHGPQFMAFDASYDMDAKGKMLVKSRKDTRPNRFLGKGLRKLSTTQVTANFNYEKKVEDRGGEFSGKGSWHTVVLVNGKPSPLSVHKADVSIDANGNQVFVDGARLYLRYEIVRGEGNVDDKREDRVMRSTSRFVLPDGIEVAKDELEEFLPAVSPRKDETDFQLTALDNIVELRAGGECWRRRSKVQV